MFNETVFVRGPDAVNVFDWREERRFRVVHLEPLDPDLPLNATNPLTYKTFVENDDVRSPDIIPLFRGRALDEIPFVVSGANDLNMQPDEIPLLGLANLSLAIYRGEADYRQSLHMQGQDTLVIIGDEITKEGDTKDENEATEVGAGAVLRIAAGEGSGAEFIGVESRGISEQRQALATDVNRAQSMGARLLEPRGTQAESGEALRIRVAASTANLATIALTGAAGLESILRICAKWVGADPDEVKIRPNMDFTQETPTPELARQLGEALKTGKIPLSAKAVHKWRQAKNFTKFTYDQELLLIAAEKTKTASLMQAEAFVGRTDEVDEHSHSYMLFRFPDGSVNGITDIVNDHFHVINEEGVTEVTNKHVHKLLEGESVDIMQAEEPDDEETPEEEGSGEQE